LRLAKATGIERHSVADALGVTADGVPALADTPA
jgi:hypothetical protein